MVAASARVFFVFVSRRYVGYLGRRGPILGSLACKPESSVLVNFFIPLGSEQFSLNSHPGGTMSLEIRCRPRGTSPGSYPS